MGAGHWSCGSYVQSSAKHASAADRGRYIAADYWVFGVLSAENSQDVQNEGRADFLKETDVAAIKTWLQNFCRSHPLNTLDTATVKLLDELRSRAATR
jgi:hypothetical protein